MKPTPMDGRNLFLRFVLELAGLVGLGLGGWSLSSGPWRWALAIVVPVAAAAVWGTFTVRDDPSRSGRAPVPINGSWRLVVETVFFAGSVAGFALYGSTVLAFVMASLVAVHYALSRRRLAWLLDR